MGTRESYRSVTIKEVEKYVRKHEQELRRKYGRNYIAVLGEAGVIDYDRNKFDLFGRIISRTHTANIDDILKPREVHLPSPRIKR